MLPHVSIADATHLQGRLRHNGLGTSWDQRVEAWETIADSPSFRRLAELVCALAEPTAEDEVVDLGAGTGLLALALAPSVRTVTALDSSAAMLDRLLQKASDVNLRNVQATVADLRCLPLPDESVNLAVSNYAFHHLNDEAKEIALSEVRRVLVRGGRFVVCDMMFSLSPGSRDRRLIIEKLWLVGRRGPAGLLRIAKNGARILTHRWEHPAPAGRWEQMLAGRHFEDISVQVLEHEAGVATARRPEHRAV